MSLYRALKKYTDWEVSVAIPNTQRSWIGKAHMIGQDVTASYIYPNDPTSSDEGYYDYQGPYDVPQQDKAHKDEWVLLDATPASCANIGIHHMFNHKSPVDLVISGPNFGRNSTALYIMSSGTVGAAMEAALCGVRAIGISYAYETKTHDHNLIDTASRLAVELVEHLYTNWDTKDGVQLYSVNIPLVEGLGDSTRVLYAHILQNQWGPVFEPWEDFERRRDADPKAVAEEEELHIGVPVPSLIEDGDSNQLTHQTNGTANRNKARRQFRWKPDYQAVRDSVKGSKEGNDGWAVDQGHISVTPLRACFHVVDIAGDIKLQHKK